MPQTLKDQANQHQTVEAALQPFSPVTPPSSAQSCASAPLAQPPQPAFGLGNESQLHLNDMVPMLTIDPSQRTKGESLQLKLASEQLGDLAGEHMLRQKLEEQGIVFDPASLYRFSASRVFNMVYLHPAPPANATAATYSPEWVVVVECKGGSSTCGEATSYLTGNKVIQGTPEYCESVAAQMKDRVYHQNAKDKNQPHVLEERRKRRLVGTAVTEAQANGDGVYMVVRGDYDETTVYQPELIGAVKF